MGYDPSAFGSLTSSSLLADAPPSAYRTARTDAKPANTSAVRACCECKVFQEGPFTRKANSLRQKTNPASTTPGALKPDRADAWRAEILIDGLEKKIYVTTRLAGVNMMATRSTPEAKRMTDAQMQALYPDIVDAIRNCWNAIPYKLEIEDNKCKAIYTVEFNPVFFLPNPHYTISFYNVDFDAQMGRSAVGITDGTAHFNFGDSRSVIGNSKPGRLEAHEYGHMLGLLDEYFEFHDINKDGDGLDLTWKDKATGVRSGKFLQGPGTFYNSALTAAGYDARVHELEFEKDLGGIHYVWPAVTGLPAEGSPDDSGLMGGMSEIRATRRAYINTVAYAVIDVLKANGRTVSKMTVHA